MAKRRSATALYWESPLGERCVLLPMPDRGLLEIEFDGNMVIVHSRRCILKVSTTKIVKTELSTYEFCMDLARCQITWNMERYQPGEEIERSEYFQQ